MGLIRQELADYGRKISAARLTAGAGGNISARDGRWIWIKPSGFAMEELTGRHMCAVDLQSGRQVDGAQRPSSELPMHLGIYRARPDVNAVFHTHSPWACGVISSGIDFKPMFPEVINDLGAVTTVPYKLTSSQDLADAVTDAARHHETIFMANHGVVTLGRTMKQAYYRACIVEDAARSLVAATIVGRPVFLTDEQIAELKGLEAGAYRLRVMESN